MGTTAAVVAEGHRGQNVQRHQSIWRGPRALDFRHEEPVLLAAETDSAEPDKAIQAEEKGSHGDKKSEYDAGRCQEP